MLEETTGLEEQPRYSAEEIKDLSSRSVLDNTMENIKNSARYGLLWTQVHVDVTSKDQERVVFGEAHADELRALGYDVTMSVEKQTSQSGAVIDVEVWKISW